MMGKEEFFSVATNCLTVPVVRGLISLILLLIAPGCSNNDGPLMSGDIRTDEEILMSNVWVPVQIVSESTVRGVESVINEGAGLEGEIIFGTDYRVNVINNSSEFYLNFLDALPWRIEWDIIKFGRGTSSIDYEIDCIEPEYISWHKHSYGIESGTKYTTTYKLIAVE